MFLPGESQGRGSLVGCRLWGRTESDTTEWLHFHFSLSCIGEWNGNPLQCSCLENPRDGGAWWAAVYGVAQSRTRLKPLSSSSSNCHLEGMARPANVILQWTWQSCRMKMCPASCPTSEWINIHPAVHNYLSLTPNSLLHWSKKYFLHDLKTQWISQEYDNYVS